MFTGIIQSKGTVFSIEHQINGSIVLQILYKSDIHQLISGDSISVNGVCQTVVSCKENPSIFEVFVIPETLKCTNFQYFKKGSLLNLEDPLTLQTKISGHLVQGHVDGVAKILNIEEHGGHVYTVYLGYSSSSLVVKGSVVLDGISLTIQGINVITQSFWVQIIPETFFRTNVSKWKQEHYINIELDYIIKAILQAKSFVNLA